MRKFICFIAIYISIFELSAQGIQFVHEGLTTGQGEAFIPFYTVSGVVNNTGEEQIIIWERLENNMPCDWLSSVCDINLCYAPNIDSNSFALIDGDTMYLSINFYPQNQEAEGSVVMRAFLENNPGIADTLTFVGITTACPGSEPCVTGLNQLVFEELSVYPNPFSDYIIIENISAFANVLIYNLQGQLQFSTYASQSGKINLEQLDPGSYIVMIQEGKNLYQQIIIKE